MSGTSVATQQRVNQDMFGSRSARLEVKCLHRRAAGAEINPVAADLESMLRIAAVKNKRLAGAVDNVFDHVMRVTQATQIVYRCTAFERLLGKCRRRIAHAEFRQHPQRGVVDLPQLPLGERPVLPADRTWRCRVDRRWFAAFREHRLATAPSAPARIVAHARIRSFSGS
jgi:hypothetical protein